MSPENTLYHMEFGLNDIGVSGEKWVKYNEQDFDKYMEMIESVRT